ncbi:MAG: restriction endonuclease subunit S [Methylotenera sp.]|uniref:restriction endonuclease subunit S n=1 Tax=Methylotenera TaxID=359407 RepID=UPI0003617028|nr:MULTISPECIES: restriction endonuclease subunit S [Methylotenera]MDP3777545.1 restriction endonuclease subunit S [Methylotenera sp.]PPC97446.1 MAG: restriction endonuclease subunit S [Methylotenera sp.]PPC98695.1 MAG: restriction endonuclease subunit S [Methylotenera sp.]
MSELKSCKLGDVVSFGNGKARPSSEGGIPIYGGNGILGFCANNNYEGETIVIGRVGAYCGATYYENRAIWVSDNALSAKPKGENYAKFIYYFLKDMDLNQHAGGSSHPLVTQTLLNSLDIEIPENPEEQKVIASVLSCLDDKIDLLHRQNTTLEHMAETLFRQWFIEEALEDWEFGELGEYVDCFNGVSYKSSELNPSKVAMVTLKSFDRNGGFRLDGFKEFTGRFKEQHIVVQGDLVVAHTDITQDADVIGNPVLVVGSPSYETIVISMDLVKVTSKFEWLSNEFLYRMMRTREFKEHCLGYSNGSTVLHLSKQAVPSFEFFMPPKEKIESYTKLAKDLFSKKFKNIEQIQTLEKLRDTLLPKLMSGEIRVEV